MPKQGGYKPQVSKIVSITSEYKRRISFLTHNIKVVNVKIPMKAEGSQRLDTVNRASENMARQRSVQTGELITHPEF